jgi:hypothetical protein
MWEAHMTGRKGRATGKAKGKRKKVTIFISYAREDIELARCLEEELNRAFTFGVEVIVDTKSIKLGDDFRSAIDKGLDEADILLIVFTNQQKGSHSYTGYEVGYFSSSKAQRPFITDGIERAIIPFCLGSEFPDTAEYMQGVEIHPNDVFSFIADITSFATDRPKKPDDDNPVLKLLMRIAEIATSLTGFGADQAALRSNIRDSAQRLYETIFSYLQTRVYSESFPERKIIIRAGVLPQTADDEAVLSGAEIELVGRSFELFGIPETQRRVFTWCDFLSKIKPTELAPAWNEGMKLMVSSALHGDFDDNYHVVSSLKRDKAFRMFVSRIVTYYSGQTEIHVYIVEIRARDYGDQVTTRLLKAISVGLKFRFLVLESQSPFTPESLSYPTVKMKPLVNELLQQMNLILRESRDARLEDPDILKRIFGEGGAAIVASNMRTWNDASARLYKAANLLLGGSDPDSLSEKEPFLKALIHFAEATESMNRDFTSKALKALDEEITKCIGIDSKLVGRASSSPVLERIVQDRSAKAAPT